MTAVLEGSEWSAARPGRTLPPGMTRYPFYRRLGGSQGRSGHVRIISSPPGFDPGPSNSLSVPIPNELPGSPNTDMWSIKISYVIIIDLFLTLSERAVLDSKYENRDVSVSCTLYCTLLVKFVCKATLTISLIHFKSNARKFYRRNRRAHFN